MERFAVLVFLLLSGFGCRPCAEPCVNGRCTDRVCHCDAFWAGNSCTTSSLAIYNGDYTIETSCGATAEGNFVAGEGGTGTATLWWSANQVELLFSDNEQFQIETQTIDGQVCSGEGQSLADGFSMRYSPVDGGAECTLRATRNE